MWMEVFISGIGEKVELKPIGKTYRWGGDAFEVVDESPRVITTKDGDLELNFVDTSGTVSLPDEQTIYYGKYAIKSASSAKTIFIDFSDANYPYGAGIVDIVGKWSDFNADETYSIWEWRGNNKIPRQDLFN